MFGWLLLLLFLCYLLKWLCWPETPPAPPSPPSIALTCVRIPANGSPPHLVRLKTINEPHMTNTFLHRIPDLRSFWRPEHAWERQEVQRLDIQLARRVAACRYLQQKERLRQEFELLKYQPFTSLDTALCHFRQRQRILDELQYNHVVSHRHSSCVGTYDISHSWTLDHLPENLSVPKWISKTGDRQWEHNRYCRDGFIVRMSAQEFGPFGWAEYEDMTSGFLDLMRTGPLESWKEDFGLKIIPW
jgi:hypothetical protein